MVQAATGAASKFSLMDDHPMTPDRMKEIEKISTSLNPGGDKSPENTHIQPAFNGLLVGANPKNGVFVKNVFVQPELKVYWPLPEKWDYANEAAAAGGMKGNSQIILTIAGKAANMDATIERFVNTYYQQTRHKPISDKKVPMAGREGAELLIAGSDRQNVLYTLWFPKDGMTYVIIGKGPFDMADTFRASAVAFRDLQTADLSMISRWELEVVAATEGESLTAFNERTKNQLQLKMAAIINGISESHTFVKGDAIKTVVRVPYRSN
jgi:predicted Zn-dependent protease